MADDKQPEIPTPPTETEDLLWVDFARGFANLSVPLTAFAPLVTVASGEEIARQTQLRFLKDNGEGFLKGETPEYAKAYDAAIKRLPVSDPKKQTSALLVV